MSYDARLLMSRESFEFRAQIAITNEYFNMSYDARLLRGITNEFRAQNAITRCTGLAVRNLHKHYYNYIELHLKQPHLG